MNHPPGFFREGCHQTGSLPLYQCETDGRRENGNKTRGRTMATNLRIYEVRFNDGHGTAIEAKSEKDAIARAQKLAIDARRNWDKTGRDADRYRNATTAAWAKPLR